MFKSIEKRKIYGTILGVIVFIFLLLGASYAFYLWNSNDDNTNVNLTISKGLEGLIIYNQGESILSSNNVSLTLGDNYTTGISTTIEFWKKETVTKTIYGQLSMKILDLQNKEMVSTNDANIAKCETVKWAITTYTATNTSETLLAEGNFKDRQIDDVFALVTNIELNPYQTFYKVYIWLDSNAVDGSNPISGELISTLITAEASDTMSRYSEGIDNSGANYPVLTDGLIPVVYDESTSGWVKADAESSTSTYGWYDYDQKKWANAVLVSENGTKYTKTDKTVNISNNITSSSFYTSNNRRVSNSMATSTFTIVTGSSSGTLSFDYLVNSGSGNGKLTITVNGTTVVNAISGKQSFKTYSVSANANTTYTIVATFTKGAQTSTDIACINNIVMPTGSTLSVTNDDTYYFEITSTTITNYNKIGDSFKYENNKYIIQNTTSDITISSSIVGKYICPDITQTECTTMYKIIEADSNITKVSEYTDVSTINEVRTMYQNATPGTSITETDILAFYVWIPRYKYKVWNMSKQIGNSTYDAYNTGINISFEEGTKSTGTISCTYTYNVDPSAGGINLENELAENCTDSSNTRYYTHPAFTFGDKELKGFWMGKFELSSSDPQESTSGGGNTTSLTPRILPYVRQWGDNTVSNFWKVIYDMQTTNNIYGLPKSRTNADSHMITNMEWGAVAYLTNSKYGRCTNGSCTEVSKNGYGIYENFVMRTGCGPLSIGSTEGGAICNAYNTELGQTASTTGNIYGIYDMSGGTSEYVMGNMSSASGTTFIYNAKSAGTNFTYSADTAKYLTSYAYGATIGGQTAYNRGRLGDATSEVVLQTDDGIRCWYGGGESMFITNFSTMVWFYRDNSSLDVNTGPFALFGHNGSGSGTRSTRAALAVY